jgi:predicted regulator of Ras-like GTPase activity (Roadblock/LC7/MglB family)
VSRVLGAAAAALGFRLSLGIVFSMITAALFGLGAMEALQVGLFRYLPAVVPQVLLVPFVLRSVFDLRRQRRVAPPPRKIDGMHSEKRSTAPTESSGWPQGADQMPDFESAVEHIAAYSTVRLALLVDDEGLPVARAGRPQADSDLWAPVTNLLFDAIRRELRRTPDTTVQRIELTQSDQRIVIVHVQPFYLSVLFDSTTDELVHVRIAQATDMIKRYAEHKYPKVARRAATEVAYV